MSFSSDSKIGGDTGESVGTTSAGRQQMSARRRGPAGRLQGQDDCSWKFDQGGVLMKKAVIGQGYIGAVRIDVSG